VYIEQPQDTLEGVSCLQIEEGFVRAQARTQGMICQIRQLFDGCPLILHVDDLFLTGDEREPASEFEMKDLGLLQYFLALEVW
jgi:hypothetical protein